MSSFAQSLLRWLIWLPNDTVPENPSKNYTVWNSHKTLFLFGGRFRTLNTKTPTVLISGILLILPMALFCVFEAQWTWRNIHPAAVILFVYCWLITLSSFIKGATYDPGSLPKNIHPTSSALGRQYVLPEEYLNSITLPGMTSDAIVKYCSRCRDWRPPRTFHCSKCDQCIVFHDHHCLWLGNCIGLRNYRYFFNFLLFGVISCTYLMTVCYYRLFRQTDVSAGYRLRHAPMTFFNAIYASVLILYPLLLSMYHVYLLFTQQSTREFLRTMHSTQQLNPYKENINPVLVSIMALTKPRGFSLVRAREKYNKGDQRFVRY